MDFQQEHAELEKIIKKSYHLLFIIRNIIEMKGMKVGN